MSSQRDEHFARSHPALRPTRYVWAAGTHPAHWVPALGAWMAVLLLGLTALAPGWNQVLPRIMPFIATAALAWSAWWLIGVPNIPRFRRATDAKLLAEYEGDYDFQSAELLPRIDSSLRLKVDDITLLRNQARKILGERFGGTDPFARDNFAKLDTLAISYLRLLAALTEHANYLDLTSPEGIERDLTAAQAALAEAAPQRDADAPDDETAAVSAARQKQVELLEGRLARYKKAVARRELIKTQCQNVETTMKLLVDQAMTASSAERVGRDIDQVLSNINESETLSQELSQLDALSGILSTRHLQRQ